jgi:antitoxin (DNA-binding transcriptional repressor) of toxin-antitoxin stability system
LRCHVNVPPMKTTTMRELKHETSKVLGWAEAGEEVELTRRGKTIALLSPLRAKRKPTRPDFAARLRAIYGDTVLTETATAVIAEARGDR